MCAQKAPTGVSKLKKFDILKDCCYRRLKVVIFDLIEPFNLQNLKFS